MTKLHLKVCHFTFWRGLKCKCNVHFMLQASCAPSPGVSLKRSPGSGDLFLPSITLFNPTCSLNSTSSVDWSRNEQGYAQIGSRFISTAIICFSWAVIRQCGFISVLVFSVTYSFAGRWESVFRCFFFPFSSHPLFPPLLPTPVLCLSAAISTFSWIFSILPSETHFRHNLLRTSSIQQSSQWQATNDSLELQLDHREPKEPLVLLEGQARREFSRSECFRDSSRQGITKMEWNINVLLPLLLFHTYLTLPQKPNSPKGHFQQHNHSIWRVWPCFLLPFLLYLSPSPVCERLRVRGHAPGVTFESASANYLLITEWAPSSLQHLNPGLTHLYYN